MIYLAAYYVTINSIFMCFCVWRDLRNLKINSDNQFLIHERDILIGRMERANEEIRCLRQAGAELKRRLDSAKG